MLKRVLDSRQKCEEMERLIYLHGFGHLVDERKVITKNNTWSEDALLKYMKKSIISHIAKSFRRHIDKNSLAQSFDGRSFQ